MRTTRPTTTPTTPPTASSHRSSIFGRAVVSVAASAACLASVLGFPAPVHSVGTPPASAQIVAVAAGPYVECMRGVMGSADTRERWVDVCRRRAARRTASYERCVRGAGRAPDVVERRVRICSTRSAGTPTR